MRGILHGVGVGPGDPELMTLKAVRLIKENDIIAVPGAEVRETVAYKIAVQAVPELADKELLPIYMPMTHDKAELHCTFSALLFSAASCQSSCQCCCCQYSCHSLHPFLLHNLPPSFFFSKIR